MTDREEKDLDKQGLGDKLKGKANEYTGKAQKQMGKMTGDREQEIKGKGREMGGAAQGKAGDVERKIDKELDR
jgi:uncharacterized protein YjbJ (UPF0337 family)